MALLEQLTVWPSVLLGAGIGTLISFLLDGKSRKAKKTDVEFGGENQAMIATLRQQLAAAQEHGDKLAEVHAYSRQLEAKIKALEASLSNGTDGDAALRVQVLEQQLAEKSDLEGKLAVAMQQLNDYKAKAEMFDSVVGNAPAEVPAQVIEIETVAAQAPVEVAPVAVEPIAVEPVVEAPAPIVAPLAPKVEVAEPVEPVAPAAQLNEVASAAPQIEVFENKVTEVTSVSGSSALDTDVQAPALRVETSIQPVATFVNKDPLEKIDGIGQVYQQKLYEAGIQTFAQLAAASPSRITEVIEPQNWQQIDVMKWRREAALFAAGEKL